MTRIIAALTDPAGHASIELTLLERFGTLATVAAVVAIIVTGGFQ